MKNKKQTLLPALILLALTASACQLSPPPARVAPLPVTVASASQPAAQKTLRPQPVAGTSLFAEGPAVDASGNVYFSDINAGKFTNDQPVAVSASLGKV